MAHFKVISYTVPIRMQTENAEDFSAVFLSDLHNRSYGNKNSILIEKINECNPDLILVGGDMLISGRKVEMDHALELFKYLSSRYPVFYANGNHEYRMKLYPERFGTLYQIYTERLRDMDIILMENQHVYHEVRGQKIAIHGLELPARYFKKCHKEKLSVSQINDLIGKPEKDIYHILLAHNPIYAPTYAKWGADLTLSGHLHGGIVRLPFIGGIISPQELFLPRYDRGIYSMQNRNVIVSAGLGCHTIPIRINNPAELIEIKFKRESIAERNPGNGNTCKTSGI